MSLFSPFTPLAGGTPDTYYYKREYPLDFDAGLDYTRPATGVAVYPHPLLLGYVNGFVPQYNSQELALMMGQLPTGPSINMLTGQVSALAAFPDMSGGLGKVGG